MAAVAKPNVYPKAAITRFVDYAHGSDSNNGYSPTRAHKTIQHAYDQLVTDAEALYSLSAGSTGSIGTLYLLPGDHNVGTGFVGSPYRPVEMVGLRGGMGMHAWLKASSARVYSSSAACTALVTVTASSGGIARGWKLRDVGFFHQVGVNTALTKHVYFNRLNNVVVTGCAFNELNNTSASDITGLYIESSGDSSWHRIRDNWCGNVQFLKLPQAPNGTNYNRTVIDGNVCFYGGSVTLPTIHLEGDFAQGMVSNNTLEGTAVGITVGSATANADNNVFLNNVGESGNATNPMYDVPGSSQGNMFIGGAKSCTGTGTWIRFGASAYANHVYGNYDYAGTSGEMTKIDVSACTYPAANVIYGQNGRLLYQKVGAGANFAAGDFPSIPKDGSTFGATSDSNDGELALWSTVNGAYVRNRLTSGVRTRNGGFTVGSRVELVDASAGNRTGTLPTSVGAKGATYTVKKTDSSGNTVTVATTSSQTIDGATTVVLASQYDAITVVSDGANWQITAVRGAALGL